MPGLDPQLVVAVAGLGAGLVTYVRTSNREKSVRQADLIREYTKDLSSDDRLVNLFTDIDYGRFVFVRDERTWLGQQPEKTLVRLLDLFNSIGHNWHRRVVSLEDVHGTTIAYGIVRAHNDPQVKAYLDYVNEWDADHLGTGAAFEHFRRLAQALDEMSEGARRANRGRAR